MFHARCVIEALEEAAAPGEIRRVRSQLPNDFRPLFEADGAGVAVADVNGQRGP